MSKRSTQFIVKTWDQVYESTGNIAERIGSSGFKPDVIVGVSRGGWVPARILSDLLNNPNLASMRVEFYNNIEKTKKRPKITQCLSLDVQGKTALIVDEIADSGQSLTVAKKHVLDCGAREVKTAALFFKSKAQAKPDFYEEAVNAWIVFPWEYKETVRLICERCRLSPVQTQKELLNLLESGIPKSVLDRFSSEFLEGKNC